MNLKELFRLSITSIFSQKLRSSLTLLGVVIGVMTIIATMSIVKGLQNLMEDEMSALQAGVFQVQRHDVRIGMHIGHRRRQYRPKIGMRDVRALKENAPEVMIVAPEVWRYQVSAKFRNEATNPNLVVCGAVPGTFPNNGYFLEDGRAISEQDVQSQRPVVVIGYNVAQKLFPFRDPIGQDIFINGNRALVVGVLQEFGSLFDASKDWYVIVPITTFERWWGKERSWNLTVKVRDPSKIDKAIDQTITALRVSRGLKPGEDNNFAIWHSDQLVSSFNTMTKFIRIAAYGIASIALLVAGVGIMNIMLVSVTERTREIGIRKALGARRRSILSQFLVEAVILTEIGALIGVILGVLAAYLLGSVANLPVVVPLWSVISGILFCSVIGLLFGTWPAWKASRLDPIVALRYE